MFGFDAWIKSNSEKEFHVSILVLVDVWVRPWKPTMISCSASCFNPCFSGCLGSTQGMGLGEKLWQGFNPQIAIRTKLYSPITGLSTRFCCERRLEKRHVERIYPENQKMIHAFRSYDISRTASCDFNKSTDSSD